MPTVEKTTGGRVYIRPLGDEFEVGDRADVNDEQAAYLIEDRGDFELAKDEPDDDDESSVGPGDYTLDELEAELSDIDDQAILDRIEVAEQDGKDRDGAYELIDARRSELED